MLKLQNLALAVVLCVATTAACKAESQFDEGSLIWGQQAYETSRVYETSTNSNQFNAYYWSLYGYWFALTADIYEIQENWYYAYQCNLFAKHYAELAVDENRFDFTSAYIGQYSDFASNYSFAAYYYFE